MRPILGAAGAALLALSIPGSTVAEAADVSSNANAEALGECLTLKSTGADRLLVARWLVASLSSAPQVADITALKPGQKMVIDKAMASLFTRLIAVDCADQARALFKAKDKDGFRIAGEALGRVAITELFSNPQALAALGDYAKFLNEKDFAPVLK